MAQASDYSATWHYLKAAKEIGFDKARKSGRAVIEQMKAMPTSDTVLGEGSIRKDGRHLHNMYLFQIKKPEESKYAWDYYKLLGTIAPEDAFRPIAGSSCPLVRA